MSIIEKIIKIKTSLLEPPKDNRKDPYQPTTAEIHEQILRQIESMGTGKCSSYNLKEEADLVRQGKSSLSARQRAMVLRRAEDYRV